MNNKKNVIIALAAILIIGGGILFWSQAQEVDYVIKASEVMSVSIQDQNPAESNIEGETYTQTKEGTIAQKEPTSTELKTSPQNQVQRASAGAVDLAVQFYNPDKNVDDYWIFQVAMDTHSVDLDQIDLQESIYFVDGNGKIIEEGFTVKKSGSGHHVSQYVELEKHINGEDTIYKEFESFKMVFKNIDGVEKTELEWDMTLYPEIFDH